MKPIVVARYFVDNYIALFITKTLTNITSIDCSEACMLYQFFYYKIVKNIHLKENNKHKLHQIEEDNMYNYEMYYESYQTRVSSSVNDMKYIMGMLHIRFLYK